jgi:hypothetical protein
VVARRIALPAATVAVAGVVTVGGAVAFASGPAGPEVPPRRPASSAPAALPQAGPTPTTAAGTVTTAADAGAGGGMGVDMSAVTTTGTRSPESVVPSAADAAAITAAIRHSELTSQVPQDAYQVVGAKLSRTDPAWAWAQLLPVTGTIDRAQGVLHRTAAGWQLVQLGTYEVGCSVAPPQVRADLGLDCPSTGASGLNA